METTQATATTATTTRVASGEYLVKVSDGTTWLVAKNEESSEWRLLAPATDGGEWRSANDACWNWHSDFTSKKAAVAWLLS